MSIWKVVDVAALALLSAIFAAFTYLMGHSVFSDGAAIASNGSFTLMLAASVLVHIVLALGSLTLAALCALVYRATH